MKLNSLVLVRCQIQARLLRLPQFTCALHSRAKFLLKFRGPKLGCTLDSRKYGNFFYSLFCNLFIVFFTANEREMNTVLCFVSHLLNVIHAV